MRDRIIIVLLFALVAVALAILFDPLEGVDNSSFYDNSRPNPYTEIVDSPIGAIASDKLLPEKVYNAQRNIAQIKITYTHSGDIINASSGTGYVFSGDIILSARHVLINRMLDMRRRSQLFYFPFYVDRNGIPIGEEYDYSLSVITRRDENTQVHSASVVALGEWDTLQDFMVLKSAGLTEYPDPVFADNLTEGEKIYVKGFAPINSLAPKTNGSHRSIATDLIEYTYVNYLNAMVENESLKRNGLSMLIRLNGKVNRGFSGGLAFNERGEIVGMTVTVYENFVYLISAHDIKRFLEKVRASM